MISMRSVCRTPGRHPRVLLLAMLAQMLLTLPANAAVRVVATLPALGAIAREIGGNFVQVDVLVSPRQDPHYADARPDLVLTLARADLLLVSGLQLEAGWLPPLQNQARNAAILSGGAGYFDASVGQTLLQRPEGKVDRAQGDIHPGGNPHFLVDPRAAAVVAQRLGAVLARLDPSHADQLQQQAVALAQRLRALAAAQTQRFAQLPLAKRQIVVYHDSLPYLADWLQLRVVATVEPKPGIAPNPQQVASVLQTLRTAKVGVIAQEEYYPKNTSQTLCGLAPARLVVLPGGPQPGQNFAEFAKHAADLLYDGLSR